MKTALRKMGNSHAVIIPKAFMAEIGIAPNDPLDIKVKKGKIVIARIKHDDPRAGWAAESKAIREAGDDKLVWPDFPNEGDKDWTW